ncbi:MAG: hypothetical protein ACW972_12395 [Promethearchaeota archaeon]
MNRFPCGVKHNFDKGVVFSDDRIRYDWNCINCDIKEMVEAGKDLKDFKTARKVKCPILTYE